LALAFDAGRRRAAGPAFAVNDAAGFATEPANLNNLPVPRAPLWPPGKSVSRKCEAGGREWRKRAGLARADKLSPHVI
jgi:hypothetical protein